jgi:transcription elongation factor GreA
METGLLITKEGFEKVKDELERLKSVQRKEVAERIRDSKQFGEFLENSEYEEAKAEQAFVEGRIIELQRILQNAVVVEDPSSNADAVGVGSRLRLKDQKTGRVLEYFLVGPVEADPGQKMISYQSPLGQAVYGKKKGDAVEVHAPAGDSKYVIVAVVNG